MNNIQQEAEEFVKKKAKKLSAAERTVMRTYMSSYVGALLASGRAFRHEEALREAYQHALRCLEFEKQNF